TNVAVVTGRPPTGPVVKAIDNAGITVKAPLKPPVKPKPEHPKIKVVKSPKVQKLTTQVTTTKEANGTSKTTVSYGTAHFTIKVTNTGDVDLTNVTVSDPNSPNCSKTIGTLGKGKSVSYSCDRSNVSSSFT